MGKKRSSQQEEVLVYVNRIKKNPEDAEAFKFIVDLLHSFLRHLSLKKFFYVPGQSSDDIYQEGLYALATKAIPDYDPDKGLFLGFAKLCIKRHIITILKSSNNGRNTPLNTSVSLDATVSNDEDGPVSIGGFLASDEDEMVDQMIRRENHDNLKEMLSNKLTELEQEILELYLKNLSYADIVGYLNKTRRGRNRLKPKVVDNALCRIKKKATELEEQSNGDEMLFGVEEDW